MCMLRSQTSPSRTSAYASFSCTPPSRSDFTSEPWSTMPASNFSSRLKRKLACLFVAMSPGAALRLPFLAMALRVCLDRIQIYAAARRVDALHLHLDRVAEAQAAARALGLARGA